MAILKLRDICKDYQQGKEAVRVLKNINLTVEEGDYLAIMGPSGSGKTTLMNIIGCLDVPTSGSYALNGKNLKDLSDDDLADVRNQQLGFVFQSFHLMAKMTAVDNVALPLLYRDVPLKERRELAAEALRSVGLGDRLDFFPNQLSGGQCQRVAIARAIVGRPKLLLADEPTGALDSKSGDQIMEIFRRLSREGMTIIMITHEQAIADCADKTYHILDGELRTSTGGFGRPRRRPAPVVQEPVAAEPAAPEQPKEEIRPAPDPWVPQPPAEAPEELLPELETLPEVTDFREFLNWDTSGEMDYGDF